MNSVFGLLLSSATTTARVGSCISPAIHDSIPCVPIGRFRSLLERIHLPAIDLNGVRTTETLAFETVSN